MKKTVLWIVLAVACSSSTTQMSGPALCVPHDGPNGKPVVCIDYRLFDQAGYKPTPDPVQANKKIHVTFKFFNYTDADSPEMELQFPPDTQIHHLSCKDAQCTIDVKDNATKQTRKYTVIDRTTGKHLDPDIIIEP